MTYENYRMVFYVGAALAAGLLVLAVILFFALKIPAVIGDLSGATARKAIEQIRSENESSGVKTYKSSPVNRERGRVTDKMTPSGRVTTIMDEGSGAMATEKFNTQELETEALSAYETALLDGGETMLLNAETENDPGGTTLLDPQGMETGFRIEFEITCIHTEERIA